MSAEGGAVSGGGAGTGVGGSVFGTGAGAFGMGGGDDGVGAVGGDGGGGGASGAQPNSTGSIKSTTIKQCHFITLNSTLGHFCCQAGSPLACRTDMAVMVMNNHPGETFLHLRKQ